MNNIENITQIILDTINSLFQTLFNSIDNNIYALLDNIAFIDSTILYDSYFEKILGSSANEGVLLISNALLSGILIFYSISYLLSHITYSKVEHPLAFISKIIIFGIFMNSSFFISNFIIDIFSYITESLLFLGSNILSTEISFSNLIQTINTNISIDYSNLNIFSLDGLIKGSISFSLLNLLFSYSIRYVIVKVFVLLTPFAFLSLTFEKTSWFFKIWIKNLFSLLFIQLLISLILIIIFSVDYTSSNNFEKIIYVGGLYSLIKANSIVRDFIGGISTEFSQSVHNFSKFKL